VCAILGECGDSSVVVVYLGHFQIPIKHLKNVFPTIFKFVNSFHFFFKIFFNNKYFIPNKWSQRYIISHPDLDAQNRMPSSSFYFFIFLYFIIIIYIYIYIYFFFYVNDKQNVPAELFQWPWALTLKWS